MVNLYVFSNGNNDLSYYVRGTSKQLIKAVKVNGNGCVNVFGAFTYKDVDKDRVWTKYPINSGEDEASTFVFKDNKLNYLATEMFFKPISKDLRYLDIKIFLKFFNMDDRNKNIVVLSGHGGLFQSLLDMSQNKMFAINTIKLCNDIKVYPIDLLILDMCSMNYLEIAYELLSVSNIKNIAFFKGLTPIEGLDLALLYKMICDEEGDIDRIKDALVNTKYSIFILSKEDFFKLEKIKGMLNDIGYSIINNKSKVNNADKELKALLNSLVKEGPSSISVSGLPLRFIGYELKEKEEKQLYRCYEFAKNSYWGDIVATDVCIGDDYIMPITIPFTVDNFRHLISIYNSYLSLGDVKGILCKYNEKKLT